MHHLATTHDRFEIAEGEPGLVMTVFALPSFNTVFKVIRDRFGQPKATTREAVRARYRQLTAQSASEAGRASQAR
jgi:isocitrate dehydrogenase kinase/phosphatase